MSSYDNEVRLNRALRDLHSKIFQDDGAMRLEYQESTDCPVCGSNISKSYCTKDNFQHVKCCKCEMVYINPRLNKAATLEFYNSPVNEIYNEQKFHASVEGESPDDRINAHNIRLIATYFTKVVDGQMPLIGKKLIEIGCAKGYFLKQAKNLGADVFGVELNKVNAEIAQNSVAGIIYDKDIFELSLPSETFDIIYMRDVIEHIHNPIPFMEEMSRLLKPGGMIFLETHNIDGLIHRVVGGKHTCVFGFEHPVHWSYKTLKLALEKSGIFVDKAHFESADLNLLTFLGYYRTSTWTTIHSWKSNALITLLLRILSIPFRIPYINYLSSLPLVLLANYFRVGSTMKVIGFKPSGK